MEKDFQIRKIENGKEIKMYPYSKSKNITFEDGKTLQEKLDNGELGGEASGEIHAHVSDTTVHVTPNDKVKWNAAEQNAKTYAEQLVDSLIDTAPEALDTLKELSDALGNDPNFATTVSTEIGKKSDKGHKHTKSEITDFPTSLPANGGNADTLDGYHASDFLSTSGGTVRGTLSVSGANISATNGNFYTNQYVQLEARAGYGAGNASLWYDSVNNTKVLHANNVADLILDNNKVYHEGRKPSWDDVQNKPTTLPPSDHNHESYVQGSNSTRTTDRNSEGANGITKSGFYRPGNVTTEYPFGNHSGLIHNQHPTGKFAFQIGSAYTVANKLYFRNKNDSDTWNSWNEIYHTNNKPTPADIGAAAASHGTHVSYGTTTTGLTSGASGTTGSSGSVSRADHTHSLPAYPTLSSLGAAAVSHSHTKAQITDFPTSLPANGGNADTVGGVSPSVFIRGDRRAYTSASGGTLTNSQWYTLFNFADNTNSPVICMLRGYAHTSVLFSVSVGYSGSAAHLTILNASTATTNGGYKCIQGLRITNTGTVQVKLSGGATVSIGAQIIGSDSVGLASSLVAETGTPTVRVVVDPISDGAMYADSGRVYTTGNKPTLSDIGAAATSHTHTKAQITDFPTSLPANGGNSDTVDSKHATDFLWLDGSKTMTGKISSSLSSNTYLAANQGSAIINATAPGTGFNMLASMNSQNGRWLLGSYGVNFYLYHTAKSTIDAGTNGVTKTLKLMDESGNSSFPGTVTAPTFSGALSGNAATATTLATARTFTIGNTGKSFNGSANVSWSLSEIGAAPSSHTHDKLISTSPTRPTTANIPVIADRSMTMFLSTSSMTEGKPLGDGYITNFNWDNTGGWASQLYIQNSNSPKVQVRGMNAGAWGAWHTLYGTNNKPTPADIGAAASSHTHSYLSTGGGTVSGNPAAGSSVLVVSQTGTTSNTPPLMVKTNGQTNWGVTAELRTENSATSLDRPGLRFSTSDSTTSWTIGQSQKTNTFAITRDRGLLNGGITGTDGGWGTDLVTINTSGTLNAIGGLQWNGQSLDSRYAANSHSHSYIPLSGGTMNAGAAISWNMPGDGAKIYAEQSNGNVSLCVETSDDGDSDCFRVRNTHWESGRKDVAIIQRNNVYFNGTTEITPLAIVREASNGSSAVCQFRRADGTPIGYVGKPSATNHNMYVSSYSGYNVTISSGNSYVHCGTHLLPQADNNGYLGVTSPAYRWKQLIAVSGSINTSDSRYKHSIKPIVNNDEVFLLNGKPFSVEAPTKEQATKKDYYDFVRDRFNPYSFIYDYDKIDGISDEQQEKQMRSIGFIADEYDLENDNVANEFIFKSEDGTLSYNSSNYTTVAIIALKEAIKKIEFLEQEREQIKDELSMVKAHLGLF